MPYGILAIPNASCMRFAILSPSVCMAFDSRPLLSIVLAGDGRLAEKLKRDELLPLSSRVRIRLTMEYASRDDLEACLEHLLSTADNATLMTP